MASKDVSTGSSGSVSTTLRLTMTQGTQSIANNTSVVNWNLKLIISGGNWRADACSWSVSGDGASTETGSRSGSLSKAYRTGTVDLGSGSYTIGHNDDGTKTTSLSFSITSTFLVSGSSSLSLKLDTIPRKSSISLNGATSGVQTQITLKPKTTSFADTITATYPNGTVETISTLTTGSTSGYTVNWTPSTATLIKGTTGPSGDVVLTDTTYTSSAGTTVVGSSSITVPVMVGSDSYSKPTIGSVTLQEYNSALSSTVKTNLGISDGYLQNMSIIKAIASGITTKESSTIEGGSATFNNLNPISGTKNGNNIEFITSKVISGAASSIPTSITVYDSRNISSNAFTSVTYKVYGYSLPNISEIKVERCNSNGTYNASGVCIKCTVSGSITNINSNNKNSKQWKLYWRRKDGTWTDSNSGNKILNNSSYSLSSQSFIVTDRSFDANTSWVIKVEAIDTLNTYTSQEYAIGVGSDLMNISANGKSIAFGQRSTATGNETKFECAMDAYLEEDAYFRKNAYIYKGSSFISLIDFFYPIGSYYETSNTSFDPNVSWGGTWVEDSAGRFTIAKAAAGEIQQNSSTFYGTLSDAELNPTTGRVFPVGETQGEYVHKLELTEAPAHRHSLTLQVRNGGGSSGSVYGITNFTSGWDNFSRSTPASSGYLRWGMDSQGGGNAHNNLPPLVVVRRWHRIG